MRGKKNSLQLFWRIFLIEDGCESACVSQLKVSIFNESFSCEGEGFGPDFRNNLARKVRGK